RGAIREELQPVLEELRALRGLLSDALECKRGATDALLDVKAVAQRLGLGTSTVRKKAASCELASVKAGRRLLFRPADLDAYAEARRRSPKRVYELAKKASG